MSAAYLILLGFFDTGVVVSTPRGGTRASEFGQAALYGARSYRGTLTAKANDGGPNMGVPLGGGDVTTAFIQWMKDNNIAGDVNTSLREFLRFQYGSPEAEDLETLVARVEDHNKETYTGGSGGTAGNPPSGPMPFQLL